MGKPGGYLDFGRKDAEYRPVAKRLRDFHAVDLRMPEAELRAQAARCMDCGTPFCLGSGCPLANVIPEFNDMVYRGRWREALDILLSTSHFPEFTARVCPAPCEAACVLDINDDPVSIRQVELAIIEHGFEKGYIRARPPDRRVGRKVAIVGSGPAGLSVAASLNDRGVDVTVYDRAQHAGGILRYGIPDFKLEKSVVDRRLKLMEEEGVVFELGVSVGEDVSYRYLQDRFDAVCLAAGARAPRDLPVPGRELRGVHFAMQFLVQQNRRLAGEDTGEEEPVTAEGKTVVILGGGDTGSDCLGTALRQGAKEVLQFEIMPEPPPGRTEAMPWPTWPTVRRESSSHKEGGTRRWGVNTREFRGTDGAVSGLCCSEVAWTLDGNGKPESFEDLPGTAFEQDAELVLLAMGFVGPAVDPALDDVQIARDERGSILVDENSMTSRIGFFAAGDMARGQSLVVRAMADGRKAADGICRYMAETDVRAGRPRGEDRKGGS